MGKNRNALTQGRKRKGDEASIAGQLEEAQNHFESVCRADPLDVEAWVKLALVLKRLNKLSQAETCGRRAVFLQPRLGFAHHALGVVLHAQGRTTEAIECYKAAIKHQPDFPDAHYLLGNALHEIGRPEAALQCYRRALQLHPNSPDTLCNLGAVLIDLGDHEEAALYLQRALVLQPGNIFALSNMSHVLRLQNRIDEALGMFRHALDLAPDSIEVLAGLAGLLEKTGKLEEAKLLTEQGLALSPNDPAITIVAAQLARREKRLLEASSLLEELLEQPLTPDKRAEILIELGQIQDQLGDAAKAYPAIVEGKHLKAMVTLRSDSDRLRYLDRVNLISGLVTESLASASTTANTNQFATPIFLIGFPRSGTTLLEQILDSHPGLQSMEERGAVAHMVNRFLSMTDGRNDALANLNPQEIADLQQSYFEEVVRNITLRTNTRLVDKMPLNTVGVPVIWRTFPTAKFILAIRHPCDVCLSCLMQNFAVNEGMASFYSLEDTVRTYAAVMGAWQKYVSVLPLDFHRIRYEDLIADVEGETRKLLSFLDVEWDDAVLGHTEHAKRRGAINTPSYHQVTQPIYQDAKYRWHRYKEAFEPFMSTLQPFIEYFGY